MKYTLLPVFLFLFNTNISAQLILTCINYGSPTGPVQFNEIGYYFNGSQIEYSGCQTTPAINIAIIDSNCIPWSNCNYNFGQANQFIPLSVCHGTGTGTCRNREEHYFIFRYNDPVQMDSMTSMLNSIPPGHYVLAYTWFTDIYSIIPGFKAAFQNLGATQITSLPDTVPYIFFMEAGQPASILELTGVNSNDTLILNTTLNCLASSVAENNIVKTINIYPNPATEFLHVSNVLTGTICSIHELTGKLVKSELLEDDKINVGKLPKAMYLLSFQQDEKFYRKLFVVN